MSFTEAGILSIRCSRCGEIKSGDFKLRPDGGINGTVLGDVGLERLTVLLVQTDKTTDPEIRRGAHTFRLTGTLCSRCRDQVSIGIKACQKILEEVINNNKAADGVLTLLGMEKDLLTPDVKKGKK